MQHVPHPYFHYLQQDATVLPLLEEGAILTLGDSDMEDGDWQQMWRRELGKDNKPTSGATFVSLTRLVFIHRLHDALTDGLTGPVSCPALQIAKLPSSRIAATLPAAVKYRL